jgi:hypothetical protein
MSEDTFDKGNVRIDKVSGTPTTGHEWDGIEELNTPLPRWWVWTFAVTVIWGVAYTIVYPAWPTFSGGTQGVTAWHSREQVASEVADLQVLRGPVLDKIKDAPLDTRRGRSARSLSPATAPRAMARAGRAPRATPISTTTTGSGAASSLTSGRRSSMACGGTPTRRPASPPCRPSAATAF